jgi:hypothetical protein
MMAAVEPINDDFIARVLGMRPREVTEALHPLSTLVPRAGERSERVPFHKSLFDWLDAQEPGTRFAASREAGEEALAAALESGCKDDRYGLRWAVRHLLRAGRPEGARRLLRDLPWLDRRVLAGFGANVRDDLATQSEDALLAELSALASVRFPAWMARASIPSLDAANMSWPGSSLHNAGMAATPRPLLEVLSARNGIDPSVMSLPHPGMELAIPLVPAPQCAARTPSIVTLSRDRYMVWDRTLRLLYEGALRGGRKSELELRQLLARPTCGDAEERSLIEDQLIPPGTDLAQFRWVHSISDGNLSAIRVSRGRANYINLAFDSAAVSEIGESDLAHLMSDLGLERSPSIDDKHGLCTQDELVAVPGNFVYRCSSSPPLVLIQAAPSHVQGERLPHKSLPWVHFRASDPDLLHARSMASDEVVRQQSRKTRAATPVAIFACPRSRYLVWRGPSGTWKVFDLETRRSTCLTIQSEVDALAWSPCGSELAMVLAGGLLARFEMEAMEWATEHTRSHPVWTPSAGWEFLLPVMVAETPPLRRFLRELLWDIAGPADPYRLPDVGMSGTALLDFVQGMIDQAGTPDKPGFVLRSGNVATDVGIDSGGPVDRFPIARWWSVERAIEHLVGRGWQAGDFQQCAQIVRDLLAPHTPASPAAGELVARLDRALGVCQAEDSSSVLELVHLAAGALNAHRQANHLRLIRRGFGSSFMDAFDSVDPYADSIAFWYGGYSWADTLRFLTWALESLRQQDARGLEPLFGAITDAVDGGDRNGRPHGRSSEQLLKQLLERGWSIGDFERCARAILDQVSIDAASSQNARAMAARLGRQIGEVKRDDADSILELIRVSVQAYRFRQQSIVTKFVLERNWSTAVDGYLKATASRAGLQAMVPSRPEAMATVRALVATLADVDEPPRTLSLLPNLVSHCMIMHDVPCPDAQDALAGADAPTKVRAATPKCVRLKWTGPDRFEALSPSSAKSAVWNGVLCLKPDEAGSRFRWERGVRGSRASRRSQESGGDAIDVGEEARRQAPSAEEAGLQRPRTGEDWGPGGIRIRAQAVEVRCDDGRIARYEHARSLKGYVENPFDRSLLAVIDDLLDVVVLRLHQ